MAPGQLGGRAGVNFPLDETARKVTRHNLRYGNQRGILSVNLKFSSSNYGLASENCYCPLAHDGAARYVASHPGAFGPQ